MKRIACFIAGGALFLLFGTSVIQAQDWTAVNPASNKVLTDTTLVRATLITMQPKEKSNVHTHPAHFFYALTDGDAVVHYADGKDEPMQMKAGEYGYSDPERPHSLENTGTKEFKFLLIELKEHPYTGSK